MATHSRLMYVTLRTDRTTMSIADNVLNEALRYHEFGLTVIPIPRDRKKTITSWKPYQNTAADISTLRRWFGKRPQNIGIICGAVSGGLSVRDFDSAESYARWAVEHPRLAKSLPTVATARGRHVWARMSPVPRFREFKDGELRTDKHYVVAPSSIHPDGTCYSWAVPLGTEIPLLDVNESGFLVDYGGCNTEYTENADNTVDTENVVNSGELKRTHDVIACASSFSEETKAAIWRAIERTTVNSPKTRHRRLFDLARELKAIPGLGDSEAGRFKRVLKAWHRKSRSHIATKPFEDSWFEFIDAWANVKYANGRGPLYLAVEAARSATTPACALQYEDNEQLVLLVKLCRELQRLSDAKPFFLDCRKAGELIGMDDHVKAWRYLRGLAQETPPILHIVSAGSRATGKANEYLYLGD